MRMKDTNNERVFENANQVHKYLQDECGYSVSYNTVRKALTSSKPRMVRRRRGGGWTLAAVDAYAKEAQLDQAVDASPEANDEPAEDVEAREALNAKQENARLAKLKADKIEREMMIEAGKLTEIETIDGELAARLKGFKIGLLDFGNKRADDVAALFGAEASLARDLCRDLGVDDDKAMIVVDFMLGRTRSFRRHWKGLIDDFLEPYSTGEWWTDEMKAAWDKFEVNRDD